MIPQIRLWQNGVHSQRGDGSDWLVGLVSLAPTGVMAICTCISNSASDFAVRGSSAPIFVFMDKKQHYFVYMKLGDYEITL